MQFGEVIELLGGRAWQAGVCYWGWALRVSSLAPHLIHSLCFMLMVEAVTSQLPASDIWCHVLPAIMESPSEIVSPNKLFLPEFAFAQGTLSQRQKKLIFFS